MRYFPAEELTEGDVLVSGREVATVEPANEWAVKRPIGYTDRVLVTFTNADADYFDADEMVQTLGSRD